MRLFELLLMTLTYLLGSTAYPSVLGGGAWDIADTLVFRKSVNISNTVYLPHAGKGTVGFSVKPLDNATSFSITVGEHVLTVSDRDISLSGPYSTLFETIREKTPACSLVRPSKSQYSIWVSICARKPSAFIKVGYGNRLASNVLTSFVSPDKRPGTHHSLVSVREISIDDRVSLVCRPELSDQPVTLHTSPLIMEPSRRRQDTYTNSTTYFPQVADFPRVLQSLFHQVDRFVIPDGVLAGINYSLDHDGCLLHTVLRSKTNFGNRQSTYIRVPLREGRVSSPGQEVVLEIWPKGHYRPIHNHGNSAAMIKVLQGTLISEWYNPLVNVSYEPPQLIQSAEPKTGEVTWMLPHLFQTHRLINERHDLAAVTVQAYGFVDGSEELSDVFQYVLPNDGVWHQFIPNVDICLPELEKRVLKELEEGVCHPTEALAG